MAVTYSAEILRVMIHAKTNKFCPGGKPVLNIFIHSKIQDFSQ